MDFNTGTNKAMFYSGRGNRGKALAFAEKMNKTPIDFTPGGKYLESLDLYSKLSSTQADAIWIRASQHYASGASGKINLFVRGAAPNRVFKMIEEPILKASPKVYKWTFRGY